MDDRHLRILTGFRALRVEIAALRDDFLAIRESLDRSSAHLDACLALHRDAPAPPDGGSPR